MVDRWDGGGSNHLRIAPKHGSETRKVYGHGTVNSRGSRLRSAAAVFCVITSSSHTCAMLRIALGDGRSRDGSRERATLSPQRRSGTRAQPGRTTHSNEYVSVSPRSSAAPSVIVGFTEMMERRMAPRGKVSVRKAGSNSLVPLR